MRSFMRAPMAELQAAPVHRAVLWVALAVFTFHVATATGYGYFRDEL